MWIIPSTCSVSAPVTEGSNWDFNDWGLICEQSLMWRSKPSPARTWSQRWKRVPWMRHLSTRTLKPSHTQTFVDAWTSSLRATRASHSVQPAQDAVQTIHATCGRTLQGEFDFADPAGSSSKTLKDTFRWDCPQSSVIWRKWVTEQRGAYSARLKLAHHTNGSACLSWPTATARDWKGAYQQTSIIRKDGKSREFDALPNAVLAQWPTPSAAEGSKIGNKPNYGQKGLSNHPSIVGHPDRQKRNKSGKSLGQWATPNTPNGGRSIKHADQFNGRTAYHKGKKVQVDLNAQVQNWPTPHTNCGNGAGQAPKKQGGANIQTAAQGKLNPNWVEQLMGLTVGWTQLPTEWTD